MNFLQKLFDKRGSTQSSPPKPDTTEPSMVEDIIAALQQNPRAKPVCWIVCYEARPLQGAPPGSSASHLMIFTSSAQAVSFIVKRRHFFTPEPLTVVGVDSASRLKQLATMPARDSRYTQPPCGLLLNFTYPTPLLSL